MYVYPEGRCKPTKELYDVLEEIIPEIEALGDEFTQSGLKQVWGEVRKTMESHGFKFIGNGISRVVFEFKNDGYDCVVKIARNVNSRDANITEASVWYSLPSELRGLFLPIDAADESGWWVTQPKAKIGKMEPRLMATGEIYDYLDNAGWVCYDLTPDNVGFYEDKPVIVNYGYGLGCGRSKFKAKPPFRPLI